MRRLLALAVAVVVWGAAAVPSRAEGLSDWWWLGSSVWSQVFEGTAEAAATVLSGGALAVEGGVDAFRVVSAPDPAGVGGHFGWAVYEPHYLGVGADGLPLFTMPYAYCVHGDWGDSYCEGQYDNKVTAYFISQTTGTQLTFMWDAALGSYRRTKGTPEADTVYRLTSVSAPAVPVVVDFTTGQLGELATTTTALQCRDLATAADFWVTEVSAAGASVAPAPVCPAGSVPVRVTITNSVTGVVSDTSISAPDWVLYDPAAVIYSPGIGDLVCLPGDPRCEAIKQSQDETVWNEMNGTCWAKRSEPMPAEWWSIQPAGQIDDGSEWEQVPDEMCLDNPGGMPQPESDAESPVDEDLGVIQRTLERIRQGVEGFRSDVKSIGGQIVSGLKGLRDELRGLRGDVQDLGDGDGGDGGTGEPGQPGMSGGGGAGAAPTVHGLGDLGFAAAVGPFTAWAGEWGQSVSSVTDSAASAASASCSCGGVEVPLAGGEVELISTCSGLGAQLAGFSRVASGALLVIASATLGLRFIMSALGYHGLGSEAGAQVRFTEKIVHDIDATDARVDYIKRNR